MIDFGELTKEDVEIIKKWPEYPPDCKELDYALRDGGWLDSNFGKENVITFSAVKDNEIVGFTILWVKENNATLGIALRGDMLGKGLGTEIMCKLLKKCFDEYEYVNVSLDVRKSNSRAKRLYEKIGFKYRGEHVMEINGQQTQFFKMDIDKEGFNNYKVLTSMHWI